MNFSVFNNSRHQSGVYQIMISLATEENVIEEN